jgi:L-asparaginase II
MAHEAHDYVITDRNGIIENKHRIHAAVTDANGALLFALGDPLRITLARSAAKPAQALAILETGARQKFGFDDVDVALMCGSHSSEDMHVSRAAAMLAKLPAKEDDLRCGGHPALSDKVNRAWVKSDYSPTALCNDCSGKHAGMLAGALAIGSDMLDYHLPTHPMQVHVKRVIEDLSGAKRDDVLWALDGCNLPAPALPLRHLAQTYARVASAVDEVGNGNNVLLLPPRTTYLAEIYRSMAAHPEMVGGEDRFCTLLMEVFAGALIAKLGADGCYGIGIRTSPDTLALGAEGGAIGVAVKVEDGSIEIVYAVVMEILEQLRIGTAEQRAKLDHFHHVKRMNTMGVVTGSVKPDFRLRTV